MANPDIKLLYKQVNDIIRKAQEDYPEDPIAPQEVRKNHDEALAAVGGLMIVIDADHRKTSRMLWGVLALLVLILWRVW
ncbi:hypothetical protein [Tropicimonas sp. IMCC6043]|uniref:hypothetical protein n=1 Tax=Tropicimonas sp. IMCC6043 TaxID=2510645 RepID=UPI00101CFFBA|nr:hypothetical protein [Tropicimonas sp. IMCC6043]RYH06523.1 hypothetical protein EU800_23580 [Tropicimonas sp. IMCC6043]